MRKDFLGDEQVKLRDTAMCSKELCTPALQRNFDNAAYETQAPQNGQAVIRLLHP